MYGQRSGAAGEALKGLERAYPVAMGYLDEAYAAGVRREPLRTFGGRLIPLDAVLGRGPGRGGGRPRRGPRSVRPQRGHPGLRGRAVQGLGRHRAGDHSGPRAQIVLCLHDELLVHVPEEHAEQTRERLVRALDDSARRWTGSGQVRFVADASVIHRWSEAKD